MSHSHLKYLSIVQNDCYYYYQIVTTHLTDVAILPPTSNLTGQALE